ncbi:unnamed protein product [Spirodela intermedia]|uniref:Uncharacterized protein n=1 Tax=Spirodela intermedia TaxID=51605 RepID=A0A7I8L760_SPIIN|nr:unnamed protein product [Spirodela intermedia]
MTLLPSLTMGLFPLRFQLWYIYDFRIISRSKVKNILSINMSLI